MQTLHFVQDILVAKSWARDGPEVDALKAGFRRVCLKRSKPAPPKANMFVVYSQFSNKRFGALIIKSYCFQTHADSKDAESSRGAPPLRHGFES